MTRKKKSKSKKPVGRPRKFPKDIDKKDIYTSITVTRDVSRRLKKYRSKGDESVSDTINGLIDVTDKMGKDYFGIEKPTSQMVLDALYKAERDMKKEAEK